MKSLLRKARSGAKLTPFEQKRYKIYNWIDVFILDWSLFKLYLLIALQLAFSIGVIYVVVHFIIKYW